MGLDWEISLSDVEKTKKFIKQNESKIYARKRVKDNITIPPPEINREIIWECMFDCLLSTRQRSGPGSPIAVFLNQKPYPLAYEKCLQHDEDIENFIQTQIGLHPSIQYRNKIAKYAAHNYTWLEKNGGWNRLDEWMKPLIEQRKMNPDPQHQSLEREVAHKFDEYFKGIGPKQSRNYLQILGLTRYEIPIDSRFIRWILENQFPLYFDGILIGELKKKTLETRLSTPYWYDCILDKLQELSSKCSIFPVVLDGCVFASFDREWTEGEIPF
ncbi:MAG: hypothetical protein WB284_06875 [Methanoregula sp.]|uniref:hypothetical protein n=1 Tax=Methanoregula sp. TaxID=2052170 RepID=UPI003C5D181F